MPSSLLVIQQAHRRRLPPDGITFISPLAHHLPRRSHRGSAMIDGNGGRERTPILETRRGGIRRAVVRSPAIVITRPRNPTSASTGHPPQCHRHSPKQKQE